ncbi:restriction endonuclease [Brevibacillus formosus]|uniref:type II site-specific deoxyribonuclease n=1 Tax=Brevibacillus formosus TaxID=54913 RepID=A0A220MPQ6_9BACL|nr:TdeIII family type II restriction endonuclease [Brevibacillus formosus]ASJ56520.1 restriction endonuclease [Brevibacillus formosus]
MNAETRLQVKNHITVAMNKKIHDMTVENPFNEDAVFATNPFGARIVPTEVWKGSKFERSFVTTLGQGIFEQIGKIIAQGTGAHAENQHASNLTLNTFQTQTIEQIVERQGKEKGKKKDAPNVKKEIKKIQELSIDSTISMSVISDLYVKRQDGHEEFYSFKTVKPNKDQSAIAKKNLLYLKVAKPECDAYFGLPYNPAGHGKSYGSQSHKIPYKYFDMDDNRFVLVGSDLWNRIGQNEDTYDELLEIFDEVGQVTRKRIKVEYF